MWTFKLRVFTVCISAGRVYGKQRLWNDALIVDDCRFFQNHNTYSLFCGMWGLQFSPTYVTPLSLPLLLSPSLSPLSLSLPLPLSPPSLSCLSPSPPPLSLVSLSPSPPPSLLHFQTGCPIIENGGDIGCQKCCLCGHSLCCYSIRIDNPTAFQGLLVFG